MILAIKYLDDNTYDRCGFNADGNLYVLTEIKVQRGMGHQKANELIIQGMNKKRIDAWLKSNNAVIVQRDTKPTYRVLDS